MILNIKRNSQLTFELSDNNDKYLLNISINNKFLNYKIITKIKYEQLIMIIENIENMLFARHRACENVNIKRVRFEFDLFQTRMKIYMKIYDNQEYVIDLNRSQVIDLYSYITKSIKAINKIKMISLNRKYTYVEVRYIDVYTSRRYSYISEDKSIKVGDIVYVDRASTKTLAVVESKRDYYFEEAPYPVFETKRVIQIVTRAEQYKK